MPIKAPTTPRAGEREYHEHSFPKMRLAGYNPTLLHCRESDAPDMGAQLFPWLTMPVHMAAMLIASPGRESTSGATRGAAWQLSAPRRPTRHSAATG